MAWFTVLSWARKIFSVGAINPKVLVYSALGIAAAAFIWFAAAFVDDKYEAEQQVVKLEQIAAEQQNAIDVLHVQIELINGAAELENLNRDGDAILAESYLNARDAALAATEDEDAPIAPVMYDMYIYIDSLR